ncbi:uncharacterized protein [Ciconia boyciana]|uniref:uncharacterized protein isoform X1 n=1 Tax=Ciconia boyciana TaxID=52775 RepID=UPI003B9F383B
MEIEAAATLLAGILSKRGIEAPVKQAGILSKRGIEAPVKQLIRLIKLGQSWGHFSDTCMLFSVSEWRDFGGTMWQKTIEGDEKDEKEIKAVRGLWNAVLETLKAMKAEREVACAAAQMLGPGVSSDKPRSKPGPIARFFGLPAVKGMSGAVCKNVSELREKEGLVSLNEMGSATSGSMQTPGKTEVPASRADANCGVNAEVTPPKAPRGAGLTELNDSGGASCRPPPTAPSSEPPSAPPVPPSSSFYPPLPPSTESSGTTTPTSGEELPQSSDVTAKILQTVELPQSSGVTAKILQTSGEELPQSSDVTAKILQTVELPQSSDVTAKILQTVELPQSSDVTAKILQTLVKRLDDLELQAKRKGEAVPPCLMNPPALPRTTRWSAVIKDAILEGQWKPVGGAEGPATLAFPVIQENGQGKWAPHDWKILQQARTTISTYGVKSEATRQIVSWIFAADLMCPQDCQNLMRLLLTPTQYLLWMSSWQQRATSAAAQRQRDGDPLRGITVDMLVGQGPYSDLQVQITFPAHMLQLSAQLALEAFLGLPGSSVPSFSNLQQGATEKYSNFVDRLWEAIMNHPDLSEDSKQ